MKTAIINAKIVTNDKIIENGTCIYEDGRIVYVGAEKKPFDKTVDARGDYLIPGFVDIHCHGGDGAEFSDATPDEFDKIAKYHLRHGTTSMLATTLTESEDRIRASLDNFGKYLEKYRGGSLAGVHMEGPWLNPSQCGAQNVKFMKLPDPAELRRLKEKYPYILRVSAAPELPGGLEFGKTGKELGILMSVAHSDADFNTVEKAMNCGYALMTHLYSGMKGVTRKNSYRTAGAVEAGLYFDDLYVELIADGRHLPPELLKFVYKCKGAKRICLITDAIRASGLGNGEKSVIGSLGNGLPVIVEDDVAKTADRQSFAGSTATFDRIFATMGKAVGCGISDLVKMSSYNPSRIAGLTDRGEIAAGKRADLLLADGSLKIKKVIFGGSEI
ncbi:MAG: N-acetylglucosamine-6-phosphate deacetylase [Clostridia bacterium]|nr:N-acetylglucosamine-6-phosphate deacetylase [Clostridia bacterium]